MRRIRAEVRADPTLDLMKKVAELEQEIDKKNATITRLERHLSRTEEMVRQLQISNRLVQVMTTSNLTTYPYGVTTSTTSGY